MTHPPEPGQTLAVRRTVAVDARDDVPAVSRDRGAAPTAAERMLDEAWSLRMASRLHEAEQRFLEALATGNCQAGAYYGLGEIALGRGEREAALEAFTEAVNSDPRHTSALYQLGSMAYECGAAREAEELYRRVLEVNPKHTSASRRLAELREQARRPPAVVAAQAPRAPADAPARRRGAERVVWRPSPPDPAPPLSTFVLRYRVERADATGAARPLLASR